MSFSYPDHGTDVAPQAMIVGENHKMATNLREMHKDVREMVETLTSLLEPMGQLPGEGFS